MDSGTTKRLSEPMTSLTRCGATNPMNPRIPVNDTIAAVMTAMPGWGCDISGVRKYEDLPQAARDYVEYVEQAIGVHISYVSVGAGRDEIIYR